MTEIDLASNYFFSAIDSLTPLIDRSKLAQSVETLRTGIEEKANPDPLSIALVVAVGAAGLSKMTDYETAGAGIRADRRSTIRKWLGVASSALSQTKVRFTSVSWSYPSFHLLTPPISI
jgi:hypothetical protein